MTVSPHVTKQTTASKAARPNSRSFPVARFFVTERNNNGSPEK